MYIMICERSKFILHFIDLGIYWMFVNPTIISSLLEFVVRGSPMWFLSALVFTNDLGFLVDL